MHVNWHAQFRFRHVVWFARKKTTLQLTHYKVNWLVLLSMWHWGDIWEENVDVNRHSFSFLRTSRNTLDLKLNIKWNLSKVHTGWKVGENYWNLFVRNFLSYVTCDLENSRQNAWRTPVCWSSSSSLVTSNANLTVVERWRFRIEFNSQPKTSGENNAFLSRNCWAVETMSRCNSSATDSHAILCEDCCFFFAATWILMFISSQILFCSIYRSLLHQLLHL